MQEKKRYSYIKYPFSVNGWFSFGLSLIALLMTVTVLTCSVQTEGRVSMFMASVGFAALMFDILGILFTVLSLKEQERNRVFALIGGAVALIVLAVWTLVIAG